MGRVIVLGSSGAVPSEKQDTTHLLVHEGDRTVLVDCGNNPIVRIKQAGIPLNSITDIVLTHFHPDHVSGFSMLLMGMWLLGRDTPITVHGLESTISRAKKMMELFEWNNWPNFYPVFFHRLPEEEMSVVFEAKRLRVYSSPVKHLIPTIGLRFEFPGLNKVMAYSCDTEPCAQVGRLAAGADILFHEASGESVGHSSAEQAGNIAKNAGVKTLYLIHYYPDNNPEDLRLAAKSAFEGQVEIARDLMDVPVE